MIPLWLKLRTQDRHGGEHVLLLPLFLVWLLCLPLLILFIPVWILGGLIAAAAGHGRTGWLWLPLIVETVFRLKGLMMDVDSDEHRFFISFQ